MSKLPLYFIVLALVVGSVFAADTANIIISFNQKQSVQGEVTVLKEGYTFKQQATNQEIASLLERTDVSYVEVDQEIRVSSLETVPYNIDKMRANFTGHGIKVGVLDTGIATHEDLLIADGFSVVSDSHEDTHGHGTAVAGVLAALENDLGIVGIAPNIELYAVKIMEDDTGHLSDAIAGLQWAIDNDMDIVVMSFTFDTYSNIFRETVEDFYANGGILIAAAGNDGFVAYPAQYSQVISVGAVDEIRNVASFSPEGVDIVAPGEQILTTTLEGYGKVSGTSIAAPHVAGVAALLLEMHPTLLNHEIIDLLYSSTLDLGEEGFDALYGHGLVGFYDEHSIDEGLLYSHIYVVYDYGLESQTEVFWMEVEHFDDLVYDPGVYFVEEVYEDYINSFYIVVSEEGEIEVATVEIRFDDFWTYDGGSDDDHISWEDYDAQAYIEDLPLSADMECFDFDDDGTLDECWSRSSGHKEICTDIDFWVFADEDHPCHDPSDSDCHSTGFGSDHDIPGSELRSSGRAFVDAVYYDCDAIREFALPHDDLKVCDRKFAVCGGSEYETHCYYDDEELRYGRGYCGSRVCDLALAGEDNMIFEADEHFDVCRVAEGESCSIDSNCLTGLDCIGGFCGGATVFDGVIQVVTEDSDFQPLSGLQVYYNGAYIGDTDSIGVYDIEIEDVEPTDVHEVEVYCSDGITFCDSDDNERISSMGDHDTAYFQCNVCKGESDLKISLGDVEVVGDDIKLEVHTENSIGSTNVVIKYQGEDGIIDEEVEILIDVEPYGNYEVIDSKDLSDIEFIHFYVDQEGSIDETSDLNNYVLYPVVLEKINAKLDISTGYEEVDNAITDYLEVFVTNVDSGEDVTIVVGGSMTNPTALTLNDVTSQGNSDVWEHTHGKVQWGGREIPGSKPYTGIVGSVPDYITVYGDGIEGTIAAVKKLVAARNLFFDNFNERKVVLIDQYDLTGVQVYDLLHNDANQPFFSTDSGEFGYIVEQVLNNRNYDTAIHTVETANDRTVLRMKHTNTDYSDDYVNAIVEHDQPVVLAHGMHSDLNTWSDFGEELAEAGFDTWIIEPYGGPTTECDDCPVYGIDDLTEYYWPALITGVLNYSNADNVSYVGFDLGCTIALESLEAYQEGKADAGYVYNQDTGAFELQDMQAYPVDTFVGLGCIGDFSPVYSTDEFDFLPFFGEQIYIRQNDFVEGSIIYDFQQGHLPPYEWRTPSLLSGIADFALFSPVEGAYLAPLLSRIVGASANIDFVANVEYPPFTGEKISMKVFEDLAQWSMHLEDVSIGEGVQVANFAIIQSMFDYNNCYVSLLNPTTTKCNFYNQSDGFVAALDQVEICQNVEADSKYYIGFQNISHFDSTIADPTLSSDNLRGLSNKFVVRNVVTKYLDEKTITGGSEYEILSSASDCET